MIFSYISILSLSFMMYVSLTSLPYTPTGVSTSYPSISLINTYILVPDSIFIDLTSSE